MYGESEYCSTSFSTSPPADYLHHHMTNGSRLASSPPQRNMARKASSETLVGVHILTSELIVFTGCIKLI